VIQTNFEDTETKAIIDDFNTSVNEWLNDENFYVEGLQGITYLNNEEEVGG